MFNTFPSCCVALCIFCVVLCIFVFFVLFVLWRFLYCLCVYVYWTTATGWLPNCSLIYIISFITTLYMFRAISCAFSGGQIVSIQHLVLSLSVSDRPVTYWEWRYQMLYWYNLTSWGWARYCSKHVEDCNKCTLKKKLKNCASSWSLAKVILRRTVSET